MDFLGVDVDNLSNYENASNQGAIDIEERIDSWLTSKGVFPESPSVKMQDYFSAKRHKLTSIMKIRNVDDYEFPTTDESPNQTSEWTGSRNLMSNCLASNSRSFRDSKVKSDFGRPILLDFLQLPKLGQGQDQRDPGESKTPVVSCRSEFKTSSLLERRNMLGLTSLEQGHRSVSTQEVATCATNINSNTRTGKKDKDSIELLDTSSSEFHCGRSLLHNSESPKSALRKPRNSAAFSDLSCLMMVDE